MDRYEITLGAEIDERRSRALGAAGLGSGPDGASRLRSEPLDQAGLYGLLHRIRDAGLELVAVHRVDTKPEGESR